MILKFNQTFTDAIAPGNYHWNRFDPALGANHIVQRQQAGAFNRWLVISAQGGCTAIAFVDQVDNETLWTGDEELDFNLIGGNCGPPPVIGTLSVKSYRTQKLAIADFPDLDVWPGPWD